MNSHYIKTSIRQVYLLFPQSLTLLVCGCKPFGTQENSALIVIVLILLACVIFFFIKVIEFVFRAVNLYREMIKREDRIISILSEIRDSIHPINKGKSIGERVKSSESSSGSIQKDFICKKCKSILTLDENDMRITTFECPICGTLNSIM